MRKHVASVGKYLLLSAFVLCCMRIHSVNHATWLDDYSAKLIVLDEATQAELVSGYYYFSGYENLSGYYVRVEKAELIKTEDLLREYGMSLDDLEQMTTSGTLNTDYSRYEYVYIITANFGNRDYKNNADYYIELANFILVGPDYCVAPSTDVVHAIPGFNEKLGDASAFGISSNNEFEVRIAYLIDTKSETGISVDYFLASKPKLLLGQYPYEVYLELPLMEIHQ